MILVVRDNGPGLSRDQFEDPATSMGRLQTDARKLGGDLTMAEPDGHGATIRLVLPLRVGR